MSFTRRLEALTKEARKAFEMGTPMVESHVAQSLSPLFGTFGPLLESLPYNPRRSLRAGFTENVIQLDKLKRAIALDMANGDTALADRLRGDNSEFVRKAEEVGLLTKTAQDKNTMYRFNSSKSAEIRDILKRNAKELDIQTDAAEYFKYIMDLNLNLNESSNLTISPNRAWTSDALRTEGPNYRISNAADPTNVWNPSTPRNMIVFDLETAGGAAHTANVNEVYAQSTRIGASGVEMGSDVWHSRFSVNSMTMGVIGNKGVPNTLNMKFAPDPGTPERILFGKAAGDGSNFIKSIRPLLEQMADDNVSGILGQNIMGFDIDRLLGNVIRTAEYQKGGDLADIVNKIRGRISGGGFVVDTIQMLGEYEQLKGGALTRSPLLGAGGSTRSIENILLNTNLIDLMKSKKDGPTGKSLWDLATEGGGHHTGRYDSIVTSALYHSMLDEQLDLATPSKLATAEIKDILTAKAYTPMSTLSRPEDVLDPVWRKMHQMAQEDPQILQLRSTLDPNRVISAKDLSATEMFARANDPEWYMDTNVSFLEQASMHTRNLARYSLDKESGDVLDLVSSQGDAWRNMTGMHMTGRGTLNASGSMFKHGVGFDLDKFSKYQDSISALPFSHIGLPERMATMAATMGSQLLPNAHVVEEMLPGALKAASMAEDMGVSFFPMDSKLLKTGLPVSVAGGNTLAMTLPEAQRLNKIAGGSLFGPDFEDGGMNRLLINANRDRGFVNLQLEMDRSQLTPDALKGIRGRLVDLGLADDNLDKVLAVLDPSRTAPARITVGSMTGPGADMFMDSLETMSYDLRQGKRMYMSVLDAQEAEIAGETVGVVKGGPVLLGDAFSAGERTDLIAQSVRANQLHEDLRGQVHTSRFKRAQAKKAIRNRANRIHMPTLEDVIDPDIGREQYANMKAGVARRTKEAYDAGGNFLNTLGVVKNADSGTKLLRRATLPALVGGAIAAFVAKKTHETTVYDETFEMGDRSPNGYYSGGGFSAADPIHQRVSPRLNALATANLVFDSYDNRIGHTRPPGRV